jgi:hypothetical protein
VRSLTLALALSVSLIPRAHADEPPAAAAAGSLAPEAQDVTFRVDLSPTTVTVGEPLKVTFELAYAAGTRVYFPDPPPVKPFVLVSHGRDATATLGTGSGEKHVLTVLPVRPGTSVLAPIEVPYVTATGEARVAKTPELRIQAGSSLGDEADPQLAPAGVPVPVRVPNLLLIWGLSALGVALVAAALGILGYRRLRAWRESRRPPPPPRPAHRVALEKLAALEAAGLVEEGRYGELAVGVSEAVREFLGARYGFAGVDLTTWEVLRLLEGRELGRLTAVELEDFLSLCDLIKFAKFQPGVEDARSLIRRARDAVERVMEGTVPEAGAPAGSEGGDAV